MDCVLLCFQVGVHTLPSLIPPPLNSVIPFCQLNTISSWMALNSGTVNMDKSEEERTNSPGRLLRRCPPEIGLGVVQRVEKEGEDHTSGELRLQPTGYELLQQEAEGGRLGKRQEQNLEKGFYADIFPTMLNTVLCSGFKGPATLSPAPARILSRGSCC